MPHIQGGDMKGAASPRIAAFDHVRGLAVICMIISHVAVVFGSGAANATAIGHIMNDGFGTAPAAPVFMMLMGLFFLYPRDKPMKVKMLRGAKIFLLGILLNVVRFVIPLLIAVGFVPGVAEDVRAALGMDTQQLLWRMFYNMDILEFAGVAYVLLAAMQRIVTTTSGWVLAGAAVVFAAPFLWGTGEGWGPFYYLLQPLWGNTFVSHVPGDTSFPAFPWLIYPIVGIVMGKSLSSGMDPRLLLRRMLLSGAALLAAGAVIVAITTTEQFGDYYRMFPGGTCLVLGFALVWIAFFMWLAQVGRFQGVLSRLLFWSENITLVYCVQWVLFGFGMLALGFRRIDSPLALLALTPVFILLSYVVSLPLIRSERFSRAFGWFTR